MTKKDMIKLIKRLWNLSYCDLKEDFKKRNWMSIPISFVKLLIIPYIVSIGISFSFFKFDVPIDFRFQKASIDGNSNNVQLTQNGSIYNNNYSNNASTTLDNLVVDGVVDAMISASNDSDKSFISSYDKLHDAIIKQTQVEEKNREQIKTQKQLYNTNRVKIPFKAAIRFFEEKVSVLSKDIENQASLTPYVFPENVYTDKPRENIIFASGARWELYINSDNEDTPPFLNIYFNSNNNKRTGRLKIELTPEDIFILTLGIYPNTSTSTSSISNILNDQPFFNKIDIYIKEQLKLL